MTVLPRNLIAFGACHTDWIAQLLGAVRPASVRGRTKAWVGGAAFNAARHVARSGIRTQLWTSGDVNAGRTASASVELHALPHLEGAPPSYTAVLDRNGELVVGVSDMSRYDDISPYVPVGVREATDVLVDANLAPGFLEVLVGSVPTNACLYAMAVSPAKATRLRSFSGRIDVLFANQAEAEAIEDNAATFQAMLVTKGSAGFEYRTRDSVITHSVRPTPVVDVTGAGDAVTGGFIAARMSGADLPQALAAAEVAARRTIAVQGPFPLQDAE